jgi:NADPH-dependent ferric siderophore reductase
MDASALARHQTIRMRHETRRRTLTVETIEQLTPLMLRIHFSSPDLDGFVSASPDDHIKLFFATPGGETKGRDFTPRAFDPARGRMTIDFALHDSGLATEWAAQARKGATLAMGGPRGSQVVPDDFDWYLFAGDETFLPAIGRRLEELRPGAPATAIVLVEDERERQDFATATRLQSIWLYRRGAAGRDLELLRAALGAHPLPGGEGYVSIAAEGHVAKALRADMIARGHPKEWMKAAGFWTRGEAGAHHETFRD